MSRILCVDDEPGVLQATEEVLGDDGHEVVSVSNAEAALTVLRRGGIDLVLADYRLPGASGLELLQEMQGEGLDVPLVVITGYASIDNAVTCVKAGAIDYLTKPVRPSHLQVVVAQALEFVRLKRQHRALKGQVSSLSTRRSVIGESSSFRRVLDTIETAASTRATVLLQGESGTGKELLARMIHDLSGREDEAFISVNCAAMPEHLVESMLFGHEKGAFTGATKRTAGAFERANHGTLLLDEISEMRLDLQAKLLRGLQEQEFERVGGSVPVRVDVRVIATTNRDLKTEIAEGRFRSDLFYRLNVLPITVPPLRDRLDDLPILATHFVERAAEEMGRPPATFTPEALAKLERHDWPGNVRELAHAVQRAVIFAAHGEITAESLTIGDDEISYPPGEAPSAAAPGTDSDDGVFLDSLSIENAQDVLVEAALKRTGGNRTQAAKLLGVSVRTLRSWLNSA